MGTRPDGACQFFAKKGEVRCPPIAQTGRCGCGGQVRLCRVVLWWECAKGPFLFGTLHPSPTLVWSGGLHPTQIIRWPVLSDLFGRCPDGSQPSVHSGPGTCRCLPPFNVNSFRFPQCPPRFLPAMVAVGWCVDTGGQARWLQHIARLARDLDPWCFPARPVCLFSLTSNTSIGS